MNKSLEGQEIVTKRYEQPGARSTIQIVKQQENLGHGYEGRIDKVQVLSQRASERPMTFAYKRLHEATRPTRENYEKIFRNYALAKEAGLPVPRTFRATADQKGILITDLSDDGKNIVLSQNNVTTSEIKKLYQEKPQQMANFAQAEHLTSDIDISRVDTLAEKATQAGLDLHTDTWFIVVKPDGSYEFLLGDFTDIQKSQLNRDRLLRKNEDSLDRLREMLVLIQDYGINPKATKLKLQRLYHERDFAF